MARGKRKARLQPPPAPLSAKEKAAAESGPYAEMIQKYLADQAKAPKKQRRMKPPPAPTPRVQLSAKEIDAANKGPHAKMIREYLVNLKPSDLTPPPAPIPPRVQLSLKEIEASQTGPHAKMIREYLANLKPSDLTPKPPRKQFSGQNVRPNLSGKEIEAATKGPHAKMIREYLAQQDAINPPPVPKRIQFSGANVRANLSAKEIEAATKGPHAKMISEYLVKQDELNPGPIPKRKPIDPNLSAKEIAASKSGPYAEAIQKYLKEMDQSARKSQSRLPHFRKIAIQDAKNKLKQLLQTKPNVSLPTQEIGEQLNKLESAYKAAKIKTVGGARTALESAKQNIRTSISSTQQSKAPSSKVPDSKVPDSNTPNVPDSKVPDSKLPNIDVPDSNVPRPPPAPTSKAPGLPKSGRLLKQAKAAATTAGALAAPAALPLAALSPRGRNAIHNTLGLQHMGSMEEMKAVLNQKSVSRSWKVAKDMFTENALNTAKELGDEGLRYNQIRTQPESGKGADVLNDIRIKKDKGLKLSPNELGAEKGFKLHTFTDPASDAVYICFPPMGEEGLESIVADKTFVKNVPYAPNPAQGQVNGRMLDIYMGQRKVIQDLIANSGVKNVVFTGHSLGGAVSQLASADPYWKGKVHVSCNAFGPAPVGDATFAKNFPRMVNHNQFLNSSDPIAALAGFNQHPSNMIWDLTTPDESIVRPALTKGLTSASTEGGASEWIKQTHQASGLDKSMTNILNGAAIDPARREGRYVSKYARHAQALLNGRPLSRAVDQVRASIALAYAAITRNISLAKVKFTGALQEIWDSIQSAAMKMGSKFSMNGFSSKAFQSSLSKTAIREQVKVEVPLQTINLEDVTMEIVDVADEANPVARGILEAELEPSKYPHPPYLDELDKRLDELFPNREQSRVVRRTAAQAGEKLTQSIPPPNRELLKTKLQRVAGEVTPLQKQIRSSVQDRINKGLSKAGQYATDFMTGHHKHFFKVGKARFNPKFRSKIEKTAGKMASFLKKPNVAKVLKYAGAGIDVALVGMDIYDDAKRRAQQKNYIVWNGEAVFQHYNPDAFAELTTLIMIFEEHRDKVPPHLTFNQFANTWYGRLEEDEDGVLKVDGVRQDDPEFDSVFDNQQIDILTPGEEFNLDDVDWINILKNVGIVALGAAITVATAGAGSGLAAAGIVSANAAAAGAFVVGTTASIGVGMVDSYFENESEAEKAKGIRRAFNFRKIVQLVNDSMLLWIHRLDIPGPDRGAAIQEMSKLFNHHEAPDDIEQSIFGMQGLETLTKYGFKSEDFKEFYGMFVRQMGMLKDLPSEQSVAISAKQNLRDTVYKVLANTSDEDQKDQLLETWMAVWETNLSMDEALVRGEIDYESYVAQQVNMARFYSTQFKTWDVANNASSEFVNDEDVLVVQEYYKEEQRTQAMFDRQELYERLANFRAHDVDYDEMGLAKKMQGYRVHALLDSLPPEQRSRVSGDLLSYVQRLNSGVEPSDPELQVLLGKLSEHGIQSNTLAVVSGSEDTMDTLSADIEFLTRQVEELEQAAPHLKHYQTRTEIWKRDKESHYKNLTKIFGTDFTDRMRSLDEMMFTERLASTRQQVFSVLEDQEFADPVDVMKVLRGNTSGPVSGFRDDEERIEQEDDTSERLQEQRDSGLPDGDVTEFRPTGQLVAFSFSGGKPIIQDETGKQVPYKGSYTTLKNAVVQGHWTGPIPSAPRAPINTLDNYYMAYHVEVLEDKVQAVQRMQARIQAALQAKTIDVQVNRLEHELALLTLASLSKHKNIMSIVSDFEKTPMGIAPIMEQGLMQADSLQVRKGRLPANVRVPTDLTVNTNALDPVAEAHKAALALGDEMMIQQFDQRRIEWKDIQRVASEYVGQLAESGGKVIQAEFARQAAEQLAPLESQYKKYTQKVIESLSEPLINLIT